MIAALSKITIRSFARNQKDLRIKKEEEVVVTNEAIKNLRKQLSETNNPELKKQIEAEINAKEEMELIDRQRSRELHFAKENRGA